MSGPGGEPPRSARLDNAAAWLAKADNDLLNIANNLAAENIRWDTVCFHAQQAAEKSLKALLVHHGRLPSRTHDLIALLMECTVVDPTMAGLEQNCRPLNGYGVASRYPGDVYEPDGPISRQLIAHAQHVRTEVHRRL